MVAAAGDTIGGRYELVARVGVGGFGEVWRARDPALGVDVAIKSVRLPPSIPEEDRAVLLERAAREARHAAKLRDHPAVVSVHDVVEADGVPWIVMQWADGGTLADALARNGPLSEERTAALARTLLDALGAAHRAGIVHRDVKPANVLLTADHSRAMLADFGIAVAPVDPRLTRTTMVVGSPAYLAPERWQGGAGDARSDLFALGVTLYEAIEGEPPFPAANPVAALTEEPRIPVRAGRLAPLLLQLIRRDPAERPTVNEALARLGAVPRQAGEAAEAGETRRETRPYPVDGVSDADPDGGAVTVTPQRKDIALRCAGRSMAATAVVFISWGFLYGVINPGHEVIGMGSLHLVDSDRFGNGLLGAITGVGCAAAGFCVGLAIGPFLTRESATVDAAGITVRHRRNGRNGLALTLRWDALRRVHLHRDDADDSVDAVDVEFRKENRPSEAWLERHGVKRDGEHYRVLVSPPFWRPAAVEPNALKEPLQRFAPVGLVVDSGEEPADP